MAFSGDGYPAAPATTGSQLPWWKEPTKDQWYAFVAAWLGWTLDAFDFTVFLLIMHPIAQTFHVSMTAVTFVFTITLWMRLVGATASGWMGDRIGRKTPLMIAILGYSRLQLRRRLLSDTSCSCSVPGQCSVCSWVPNGRPVPRWRWKPGRSARADSCPDCCRDPGASASCCPSQSTACSTIRSAGAACFGLAIIPALAVVYVRYFVKEPEVWVKNRNIQRTQNREVKAPLLSIFKRGMIWNTLNCCWFMASGFVLYYSINVLFVTHLQVDLKLTPAAIGEIGVAANLVVFLASLTWGWVADRFGRKVAQILPALIAIPLAPLYLLTGNFTLIWWAFVVQGAFGSGGFASQAPSYLAERFPTEVRATAAGFCYHQGAVWGGLTAPILAYLATGLHYGYVLPMLVGTVVAALSFAIAISLGPETRGKELVADVVIA